jgi:hypothetical protein
VEYCPTQEMVADFFTKPLQGAQFKKFRDFIMNVDHSTTSQQDHRSVLSKEMSPEHTDGTKTDGNEPTAETTNPDMDGWTTVKRSRK